MALFQHYRHAANCSALVERYLCTGYLALFHRPLWAQVVKSIENQRICRLKPNYKKQSNTKEAKKSKTRNSPNGLMGIATDNNML